MKQRKGLRSGAKAFARSGETSQVDEQTRPGKRGRPPATEISPRPKETSRVDEKARPTRRGRLPRNEAPSLLNGEDQVLKRPRRKKRSPSPDRRNDTNTDDESGQRPRKKRGRPPKATVEPLTGNSQSKQSHQRENYPPLADSKTKRPSEKDINSPKVRTESTNYQCIAPIVRGISRHTIDVKWAPLPPNAMERIMVLLNEVERSVVMRLRDEFKRNQASTAIQMVSRRLHRKLGRGQPFPPSTRPQPEEDFDFEKILDSSSALEAKLTPILHSIKLLKDVAKKEEAMLEADIKALDELKGNAKVNESQRYNATRKLHAMSRAVENFADVDDFIDGRNQHRDIDAIGLDDNLRPILDQLRNHLGNMQSNVSQVARLGPTMGNIKAAVQDVLIQHINGEAYEDVVLG